ncbi:MAG: electron transfer flavoprotein subunit alpha/FixB family protein [Clostridia bacterium]|nr:electron transfer flavoprotein subunit alpha/FixB family protein [Clostridia bacterium]
MKVFDELDRKTYKNVWTISECAGGEIHPVSYELLGTARRLAAERGGEVWTVALGRGIGAQLESLFAYGADKIIAVDDERLRAFNDELECHILERLVEKYRPEIILCAATSRGRALIPRLAGKIRAGLTADCTGLAIDPENGDLLQTRPAFGGNIMATIRSGGYRPQMATVRPRVMPMPEPEPGQIGEIIRESVRPEDTLNIKEILGTIERHEPTVNLTDARIIVAGGRAMKGPEGFRLLEAFANRIGGAVGASRAAVDNGWIAYPHQIGQTGATVQTDVYIACGISGQIQHLIGMQSCKTIIAVDVDDTTPMMKLADIAVKGDLFEIIPAVMKELDERNRA